MIAQAKTCLRRLLPKNSFARGVGVLVGGTAGAQMLSVLSAPLLTRLYSPDDFGLVAVYTSLLALIGVISCLRYELAIPLPDNDTEAANVTVLSLILVGVISLLSGLLVLLLGPAVAKALGVPALAGFLWLLPIGVLLGGAYNVFNSWSVRSQSFTAIAGNRLYQALATITIQLTAFKLGGIALLYAQVAGKSIATTNLGRPALSSPGFHKVSWLGIAKAAQRYRHFPLFSTWEGLSNTAGLQLPPILFAMLFGPTAAGLYTLANRVMSLPMSLVGRAIGQVFFANAAKAHRAGQLGPLVARLHAKLAHIGLPPALLLILLGPRLFGLVFGEQWTQAGEFARWMTPWLYLVFVSSPLSTLFAVTEKQKLGLAFQVILLTSRIVAIGIGAWLGNLTISIILFSGASALCWLGFLFWVAQVAGNPARSMWQPTLAASAFALVATLPVSIGLCLPELTPLAWGAALSLTVLLIATRYWFLLHEAYK